MMKFNFILLYFEKFILPHPFTTLTILMNHRTAKIYKETKLKLFIKYDKVYEKLFLLIFKLAVECFSNFCFGKTEDFQTLAFLGIYKHLNPLISWIKN